MWPLGDSSHGTENCSRHPRSPPKGREHQRSLCLGFLDPRCLSRTRELPRCPGVWYCCAVWRGWWGAEQPDPAGGMRIYSDGNGLPSPSRNNYHGSFCLLPPGDEAEERVCSAALHCVPPPFVQSLCWKQERGPGGIREPSGVGGRMRGGSGRNPRGVIALCLPCSVPASPRLGLSEPPNNRSIARRVPPLQPRCRPGSGGSLAPGRRGGWRSCFVELKKLLHHRACELIYILLV